MKSADPLADIMGLTKDLAGIDLHDGKRSMVEGRLARRMSNLGTDLAGYAQRCAGDPAEQAVMIDLLTTNHTAWRREPTHFTDLEVRVLPAVARAQTQAIRPRLRIWCAAAATGEEPYTIALSLLRALPQIDSWDAMILCTDISGRALAKARAGIYSPERIAALDPGDKALAVEAAADGAYRVRSRLRLLVDFARLNLMESWPMRGPFDAIFCRNVMIYFDRKTQEVLVNRLAGLLAKGGTLYVGHSESLNAISHPLRSIAPATYVA